MNILRKISFALTETIITVIPSVYNIFERIGSHEFFSSEAIQNISNNIYILVSVCMLFAFGIKLLNTIVNPDIIDDKKKGTKKTFINGVIAVVLISVVPFLFDVLYKVQFQVLGTDEQTGEHHNLIQKIVFGTDGEYDSGSLLAGYTFAAFCYPNETVSNTGLTVQGGNYYNKVTRGEIQYIDKVGDAINDEINGEYELNYHIILAPLAGGYVLYQVILMCIDIAFRSVKLGILQLMAPLVICAFIFAGTDMLTRWIKEVISTYVIVFVKVAAITFMVYALSLLPELFDRLGLVDSTRDSWAAKGFIRVAFLIGLLQLVKKLPDLINKIFGTSLDTNGDGGIRGRLGAMAGVGAAAQRAWDALRTHPIQTAMRPVGAVTGVGANVVNRGIQTARQLRNAAAQHGVANRGLRGVITGAGAIVGAVGGGLTSIGAARRGWQNGLSAAGSEVRRYADTHLEGSSLPGRMQDRVTSALGFGTRQSRLEERDKYYTVPVNGRNRRMSFEELQARASVNSKFNQAQSDIRSQVDSEINLADSTIRLGTNLTRGGFTIIDGNRSEMLSQIEAIRSSGAATGHEHDLAALESDINHRFNQIGDNLQNQIMNTGEATVLSGGRAAAATNSLNTITDLVNDNADLRATIMTRNGTPLTANGNGRIMFDTDFRGHARTAVSGENDAMQRAVNRHDQQIEARKKSAQGRERTASAASVQNLQNNGGGGGNAGGGH